MIRETLGYFVYGLIAISTWEIVKWGIRITKNNSQSEPSTNNHSRESPSGEKLDEMPDYETPNGVVDLGVPVSPPTVSNRNSSRQLSKIHKKEKEK